MSLASTCTLIENGVRLYAVNFVKLRTLFLRTSYSVWFLLRVYQKKNLHEIWKVRVKQRPWPSEVHGSQTDGEVHCGSQAVFALPCSVSSSSSRQLAALIPRAAPGQAMHPRGGADIKAVAPHRPLQRLPLRSHLTGSAWMLLRIPGQSRLVHHARFRKTAYLFFFSLIL